MGHWPWATIAAFVAAAITLYVGQAQIDDRRRQLGRETVAQLSGALSVWTDAAIGVALKRTPGHPFSAVLLEYRRAHAELTHAVIVVQMACGDAELQRRREQIVSAVDNFTDLALPAEERPDRALPAEDVAALQALIVDATKATNEFLDRAVPVYAAHRRWRDRLPAWLRDEPRQP